MLIHSPKGTFRLFLNHRHLPKRHFVDLHLSTFALEQEETWVERPEEEDFFGLQLSSSVPLSFPLSSSSLIILPLLQSKHPNQNLSFSFSHPHPHPHPFNPNPISVSISKFNSPTSTSPTPHKPHSSPPRQLFSETHQISTPNVLSFPIVLGVASFLSSMCMRRGRRRLLSL